MPFFTDDYYFANLHKICDCTLLLGEKSVARQSILFQMEVLGLFCACNVFASSDKLLNFA